MRRLLIGCIALALLSSCAEKSVLQPDDVMKQAAVRSGLLQSAVFDVTADIRGRSPGEAGIAGNGKLTVHGITQAGGSLTQADIVFSGSIEGAGTHSVDLDLGTIAEKDGGSYFFLRTIKVNPPHPLLPAEALTMFMGQWWRTPATPAVASSAITVSPDPGLLLAQSQVINVVKDNGIRRIRGRRAYLYDIVVSPDKLTDYLKRQAKQQKRDFDEAAALKELSDYAAAGQLWVDAETFDVHRVTWDVLRSEAGAETMRLQLAVDFTAHDGAPAITPPASAKSFGSSDFLQGIGDGDMLLPDAGSLMPATDPTILDMFRTAPPVTP